MLWFHTGSVIPTPTLSLLNILSRQLSESCKVALSIRMVTPEGTLIASSIIQIAVPLLFARGIVTLPVVFAAAETAFCILSVSDPLKSFGVIAFGAAAPALKHSKSADTMITNFFIINLFFILYIRRPDGEFSLLDRTDFHKGAEGFIDIGGDFTFGFSQSEIEKCPEAKYLPSP